MDDELPILIFIILNTNIRNLYSQIALIEDYITHDSTYESERRTLINFKVAV